MSLDEFSRYWREVHAPIGRRIPGLRRLVQSHPAPLPPEMAPADFDGMAELWFDDMAALQAARRSPVWPPPSLAEAAFLPHTRTRRLLAAHGEVGGQGRPR